MKDQYILETKINGEWLFYTDYTNLPYATFCAEAIAGAGQDIRVRHGDEVVVSFEGMASRRTA